jgi:hypothetical protein
MASKQGPDPYKIIAALKKRVMELEATIIEKEMELQEAGERNETLLRLLDELGREKWSIQSELENLRGY